MNHSDIEHNGVGISAEHRRENLPPLSPPISAEDEMKIDDLLTELFRRNESSDDIRAEIANRRIASDCVINARRANSTPIIMTTMVAIPTNTNITEGRARSSTTYKTREVEPLLTAVIPKLDYNAAQKRDTLREELALLDRYTGGIITTLSNPSAISQRDTEPTSPKPPSVTPRARIESVSDVDEKAQSVDQSQPKQLLEEQFARQFFFRHTSFLLLALLFLSFSEQDLLTNPDKQVNLWYICFEMISAYGAVGLTFGIPGKSYSLCGEMSVYGKLVLMFVMILGKHRGLPDAEDEVIDFYFAEYRCACHYDADVSNTTRPADEDQTKPKHRLKLTSNRELERRRSGREMTVIEENL
jgi:hypothetical protein